ncbi:MAG: ATP-grasp domain-containing protein [Gammaproteobacteria bacterium]
MSAVIAHAHQPATRYIYNHDIMSCTADGVVGNHLFSGRALGITEPWDMIQLHEELKPLWKDITAHYDRIGLSYTQDVIWYLNRKQLGLHVGYHPSVFYFGPDEYGNWGDFEWYDTVAFINSKNSFMALAEELGVDVPVTLCFDSVDQIDDAALSRMTWPCYLKAAESVSGIGIYRCEDKAELMASLGNFSHDLPVQLQEEVKSDIFLNLQYQVIDDTVFRLTASEQILDGFAHQGNRVPARYAPWKSVDRMAVWLKDHGIKGIFAFDVAVMQTSSGLRFPAIECNPRYNGATYPALLAGKLGIPEWTALSFTTPYRTLKEIDLSEIEYDKKTGEGAVIVNWGTLLAGKVMILLAGSQAYQDALRIELTARLC